MGASRIPLLQGVLHVPLPSWRVTLEGGLGRQVIAGYPVTRVAIWVSHGHAACSGHSLTTRYEMFPVCLITR